MNSYLVIIPEQSLSRATKALLSFSIYAASSILTKTFSATFFNLDTPLNDFKLSRIYGSSSSSVDPLVTFDPYFKNQGCLSASYVDSLLVGSTFSNLVIRSFPSSETFSNSLWLKWYFPAKIFLKTSYLLGP